MFYSQFFKRTHLSLIVLSTFSLIVSHSLEMYAQTVETPTDSMPTYSIYRKELLRKGWLPIPQKSGIRLEVPEVVCGASGRLCTAYWLHSKLVENRERKFILWGNLRGLIVAPYLTSD